MTIDIVQQLNGPGHGHSGFGVSYWSDVIACGKRQELVAAGLPRPEHENANARVGVAYHKLHELNLLNALGDRTLIDARKEAFTVDAIEALRCYDGWLAAWGSLAAKYGARGARPEVQLGGDPKSSDPAARDVAARVERELGGRLSGRADVYDLMVSFDALPSVFERTGLLLPGAGRYMLDWKSSSSQRADGQQYYAGSMQSRAYLWLANLEAEARGEEPFLGIIFDVLVRHKTFRKVADSKGGPSFAHYLAVPEPDDFARVKAMVDLGLLTLAAAAPNPLACAECTLYNNGCGGF